MLVRSLAPLAMLAMAGCFDFDALRHDDAGQDLAVMPYDLGVAHDEGLDGPSDLLGGCVPTPLGTGCVIEISPSASAQCHSIGAPDQVACDTLTDGVTWMASNEPNSTCAFLLEVGVQQGTTDSTLTQANMTIHGGYAPGFACRYPAGDASVPRTIIDAQDPATSGPGALTLSPVTLAIDQVDFDLSGGSSASAVAFTLGDEHQLSLQDSTITMSPGLDSVAVSALQPMSPTSSSLPSVTLDGVTIDAPASDSDATGIEVGAAASVFLHHVVMHLGSATAGNATGVLYDTSAPVSEAEVVPTLIVQESEIHAVGRSSATGFARATSVSGGNLLARNVVVTAGGSGTTKCFDWNLAGNGSTVATLKMSHSNCSSSGSPSTGMNLSSGTADLAGVIIDDPQGSSVTVANTIVTIDDASILYPPVVDQNGGGVNGSTNVVKCDPELDANTGRRTMSAKACVPMQFEAQSNGGCDIDYTVTTGAAVTTSIDGATRPVGPFCDIGAEEL